MSLVLTIVVVGGVGFFVMLLLMLIVATIFHKLDCNSIRTMGPEELAKRCPNFELPVDDEIYLALAGIEALGRQGLPREKSEPITGLRAAYIEARRLGLLVEEKERWRNPEMTAYDRERGGNDFPNSLGVYWHVKKVDDEKD